MVELLATDTGVVPFAGAGNLVVSKHSALLGHTTIVEEPLGSGCIVFSAQTTSVVVTK